MKTYDEMKTMMKRMGRRPSGKGGLGAFGRR
jgi:hypothetical protein